MNGYNEFNAKLNRYLIKVRGCCCCVCELVQNNNSYQQK